MNKVATEVIADADDDFGLSVSADITGERDETVRALDYIGDREGDSPAVVDAEISTSASRALKTNWIRGLTFTVLPGLALLLAVATGALKWQATSARENQLAATETMQVARDTSVAILSYRPETVEDQLTSARNLLTGPFLESYTALINDVVIPGSRQQSMVAEASVPAVASVSATPEHAVAVVYINQTSTVANGAPTVTASTVTVTMDKIGDRWLVSGFDPV